MKRLLRWSTALIAAAMLAVAGGAVAITYAAVGDNQTDSHQVEQTGQQEDPAGQQDQQDQQGDQGPGQTGDNQGDHQDPGDQPGAEGG